MSDVAHAPQLAPHTGVFSKSFWAGACLFVLVVVPFLPAIHGQYTWDDNLALTDSAAVHAWNGLPTIWNPFRTDMHFFPLTFSSYWVEHKLWGLDPTGYHLDNMLLQGAAAVVLWRILKRLGLKMAWLAALIWAIHPIQAESVAWVAERKNTLSGVCFFLAMLSYLHFERIGDEPHVKRNWAFYGLAFIAFIGAMLAKSVTCTFPAGMLLLLWWKNKKLTWRTVWPLIPVFAAAAAFSLLTALHELTMIVTGEGPALQFSWAQRCVIAGKDVWFYLWTLLVPYPSMPVYPRWTYAATALNELWPLSVIVVLVLLWALRRRVGLAPFLALMFFLVTVSPLLGFISFYTMHYTFVADHYQYLACAGIIVPAVEFLGNRSRQFASRFAPQKASMILRGGASLYVLICLSLSAFYASLYQTNVKLWTWNVNHNPAAYVAQQNLGSAEAVLHEMVDARRHVEIALAEAPEDDSVQRMAGLLEFAEKRYPEALQYFRRAIEIRPGLGLSYMYVGDTYMAMHDLPDALEAFAKSVELATGESRHYFHYAGALVAAHQQEKAAKMYSIGILLAPGNMIARYNYGNLLLDMGRYPEAIAQYQFILKYQDKNSLVWHNLASAYYHAHRMDEAMDAKKRADTLDAQLQASPTQDAPAVEQ